MTRRDVERVPVVVGCVTLVAGASLVVAPERSAGPLGLEGQGLALRALGLSDLVLVPGLLLGRPRWPWMAGRAALSLAQAAYLQGGAARSSSPERARAAAALLVATAMDGATAIALRRARS